jgi:hypothetical protein
VVGPVVWCSSRAAEPCKCACRVQTNGSRLRGGQEESDNSRAQEESGRGRTGTKPGNGQAVTVKRSNAGTGSKADDERVHEAKPMSGDSAVSGSKPSDE